MVDLFLSEGTFTFSSVFPHKTCFQREMEKHVLVLENETLFHMSIHIGSFYSVKAINLHIVT